MPDPITDIADPKIQGELDGLRLLVEETTGNVIAFVRYERVTEREAGIRYLKEQFSVPVVERVLSEERKNPLALLDNLPDERCCVQLYDLEAALPEVTGYLNVNREAYADVPHALVFWVGEHGLREVATNAPDFWAWRSGVFDVWSDEADLSQSMSQVALADDVQFTDRGDLERRADLYEGLIQEYGGADEEYVARLRLKLSAVFYWLRRFELAEEEVRRVKEYAEQGNKEEIAARAYNQIGKLATGRRDFDEANGWYRKAMEIWERLENEGGKATVQFNLGVVAHERQALEEAEKRYRKAMEIWEHLGEEHSQAATYHNLGMLAQERGDLEEAEEWYQRAMGIEKNLASELGTAETYHQLGVVAKEQRNFEEAEEWYRKSVEISGRLGEDRMAANTYHNLGVVAQERGEFEAAEQWYCESLELSEQLDDRRLVAETYHGLGVNARSRREFEEAKQWYQKSGQLRERLGDEGGAAWTYLKLGHLAREQENLREAGHWYLKTVLGFHSANEEEGLRIAVIDFVSVFDKAASNIQEDLRQQWIDAGLPENELDDLLDQARAAKSG